MTNNPCVLIVDDSEVNRRILSNILSVQYSTFEVSNGSEALSILNSGKHEISAILLDIVMPEMNGFQFLSMLHDNVKFHNIPVLVLTGQSDTENEVRSLSLGAWDFIPKPYTPEIIYFRLKNAIARSELAVLKQLSYMAEYDDLTGIYNKSAFFTDVQKKIQDNPERRFIFLRFDIDRFSLINAFFGEKQGDDLLVFISSLFPTLLEDAEIYTFGRIEADVFAAFFSVDSDSSVIERQLEDKINQIRGILASYNNHFDIVPSMGLYSVIDPAMSPSDMYDRATIAAKTAKGSYVQVAAWYTEEMHRELEKEQLITNEMKKALNEGQFIMYLQPKKDLKSNRIVGAEALVRWKHPTNGMVSPGEFIPIFEHNGFISQLDYYMWESACRLLADWVKRGINDMPISVNVSRVNLYNPKIVDLIYNLTVKYGIEPKLLQLELTESSFVDSSEMMNETMQRLQEKGFIVLMDDFGSGYSSLNTLKDLNVDVLKIDMKFLNEARIPGRGESIIASVIRMAKLLGIPVIAEGAENREQVEFLRSIGCEYVQGYFVSHPIPVPEFEAMIEEQEKSAPENPSGMFYSELEKLIVDSGREEDFATSREIARRKNIDLVTAENQFKDFLKNRKAACIFEYSEGKCEIIRMNETFIDLFGFEEINSAKTVLSNLEKSDDADHLIGAIETVTATKQQTECCITRKLKHSEYSVTVKLVLDYAASFGSKHLLFGTFFGGNK